jgi:hypothetical protein
MHSWLVKAIIVLRALAAFTWQIGPLVIGLLALAAAPAGRAAQAFIAAMLVLFGVMMPASLSHNDNRYLYVLVPLLVVGLAYARAQPTYKHHRLPSALIIAAALYAIATTPVQLQRYVRDIAFTRTELEGVADWVRRNLPADARIAVHDAGYIAFATNSRLIDVVGLKTPDSQRVHEARTEPSGGADRGEALAQILVETQSEYLVVFRRWDSIFNITAGVRAAGVELIAVRAEGEYQVFHVRTSGHNPQPGR